MNPYNKSYSSCKDFYNHANWVGIMNSSFQIFKINIFKLCNEFIILEYIVQN